jgi:hypothetical protein
MIGGILDEEEKEYLLGRNYDDFKPFTPLLDAEKNWILPLYQIFENKNLDCWWVRYLPIVEYKH